MNILELHTNEKEVSAVSLFKGELGTAMAMQLQREGALKEHMSKTPALLVCVSDVVTYEDEKDQKIELEPGDYDTIVPNVNWLYASVKSHLLLLK